MYDESASHLASPERVVSASGFVHPVYFDDLDDKAVCPTDTETKEYKYNV
jgi:hypothetical protein